MDKLIIEQNPHWKGTKYPQIIDRQVTQEVISLLDLEEILVLLGVRRCGKTTMFRTIINHLMESTDPKSILYLNLDAPFFDDASVDAKYLYTLVEAAEKINQTKVQYLLLDEIQNIPRWEKYVKSSYDSQIFKKIMVTGSNAKLLESEYTTLLSGRYLDQFMTPLRYKEFINHNGINDILGLISEKSKALALTDQMLKYGCFPKVYLTSPEELKIKMLNRYYETILLKDCLAASNTHDSRLLKSLSHYLLTNVGTRYSYKNLSEYLNSNEHTTKDYISSLASGYLVNEIQQFSYSLKKQARGKKKAYCIDNGLINAVSFNFFPNDGQLFENLVFTELLKNNPNEIFLYNEAKECDFIVQTKNEFIAIQSCYQLTPSNRTREIDGLKLGMGVSKTNKGIIITYDQEETISKNISAIPFWKLFFIINDVNDISRMV